MDIKKTVSFEPLISAYKKLVIKHIPGLLGACGRNSYNGIIKEKIVWQSNYSLSKGLGKTYTWIKKQVDIAKKISKLCLVKKNSINYD